MRAILLALLVAALTPAAVPCQAAPSASRVATYDSVFAQAFIAYDRQDWRALARLADPPALEHFRDYTVAIHRLFLDIPAANGGADGPDQRASIEKDYEAWAALSAESLFVRAAREQIEPYFNDPRRRPTVRRQVLGHTLEGDSLVHVVFRYMARWGATATKWSDINAVDVLTL